MLTKEEEEVISKEVSRIQKKLIHPETNDEKTLKYLHNLRKLPVSLVILKSTGIGKTVNELKRKEGNLGKVALDLVTRWKTKFSPQKSKPETLNHQTEKRNYEPRIRSVEDESRQVVSESADKRNHELIRHRTEKINHETVSHRIEHKNHDGVSHRKEKKNHEMINYKTEKTNDEGISQTMKHKNHEAVSHKTEQKNNEKDKINHIKMKESKTKERVYKVHSEYQVEDVKKSSQIEVKKERTEIKTDISLLNKSVGKSQDHWKDVSLNLLGVPKPKKKKKKRKHTDDESLDNEGPKKLKSSSTLSTPEPARKKHIIEVRRDPSMPTLPEIALPEIQRTYRPLRYSLPEAETDSQRKKANVPEMDLEVSIVSRKSRTQVYSGTRRSYNGVVPSLYQQCMKVLIENMDALEDTGGVPFQILEPLLSKATPAQLIRLEEFNPYFTEDSGELWKVHGQREFRGSEPEDMESWREMYLRRCAERVEKLKNIQSKISISQAKKDPVRQAKLAYVAGPPKPSAQIRRKQIRYGTGEETSGPAEKQKPVRRELEAKHKNEAEHTVPFIKIPRRERCSTEPPKRVPRPDILSRKPASRPMMKAALKMMKKQRSRSSKQIIRR